MTQLNNIVATARAKADKLVRVAEQEFAVRSWVANRTAYEPRIVVDQNDYIGVHFNVKELTDILPLFDAFDTLQTIEYQGRYHSQCFAGHYKLVPDEELSENYMHITASGRHHDYLSGDATISLRMYATGPFDKPLQITVDMGRNEWPRGTVAAPSGWQPSFQKIPPVRHGCRCEYRCFAPPMFNGFSCVNYGTGAPQQGMAYQGLCFIPTRAALEMEIDRVLAAKEPIHAQ